MAEFHKVNILGVEIHNVVKKDVLSIVEQWISSKAGPRMICTPNADHIIKALRDRDFLQIINQADLSLSDGMAVVYASRILRQK